MNKLVALCAAVVVIFAGGYRHSDAQSVIERPTYLGKAGLSYSVGIQRFINSFSSYQFPNPFPPEQDPLSRLEFPIDQWFFGLLSGITAPCWELTGQLWFNLNQESALKMQDSDWDDEFRPSQKTIFSESQCRLDRGILVDVGLSFSTPLERFVGMRPVTGLRHQYFKFTTHDGVQWDLSGHVMDLPGDGIEFRQTFYHLYLGASFARTFFVQGIASRRAPLNLGGQVDYALVWASNEDLHLLRSGNRITEEDTRGHCWHVSAWVDLFLKDSLKLKAVGDLKRVVTDGSHRLTNSVIALDFSFDGSRVWSDQVTVSAVAELTF
ncbi:MAG: omptin family outer membrane protease [Thermodesulfobacteriota bacterium]